MKRSLRVTLVSTLLLSGALLATAAPDAASPRQVATWLDGIVQPRFQQNAGQFGVDRIVKVSGHDHVYGLDVKTPGEKRNLARVNAARHPFVIAFLHCAHKPGRNPGISQRERTGTSLSLLATGTGTQDSGGKLYRWGDAHLKALVVPSLPKLRQGRNVDITDKHWLVSLRPVQAKQEACLGCHVGAKHNDTLGVMVYAVNRSTSHAPLVSRESVRL